MIYPAFWGTNHPSILRVVGDEVIMFQESKGLVRLVEVGFH